MDDEYQEKLQVLFELRDALIEIFPGDTDRYISANELLNTLERKIREEAEVNEFIENDEL